MNDEQLRMQNVVIAICVKVLSWCFLGEAKKPTKPVVVAGKPGIHRILIHYFQDILEEISFLLFGSRSAWLL
jgi:hypothetical protein